MFKNHKKVQVVLLRGLTDNWKQVIFYDLDRIMNIKLLNSLITMCEESNGNVRGIVCDMGNQREQFTFKNI